MKKWRWQRISKGNEFVLKRFFIKIARESYETDLEVRQTLSDKTVKPDKLSMNCTKTTILYIYEERKRKKRKFTTHCRARETFNKNSKQ